MAVTEAPLQCFNFIRSISSCDPDAEETACLTINKSYNANTPVQHIDICSQKIIPKRSASMGAAVHPIALAPVIKTS